MKKKQKKFFRFANYHIGVYGENVTFVNSNDKKKITDFLLKQGLDKEDFEDSMPKDPKDNGNAFYVYMFDDCNAYLVTGITKKTVKNYGIIAHESLHIAATILHKRGLYLAPNTHEAYTYLMQNIFERYVTWVFNNK